MLIKSCDLVLPDQVPEESAAAEWTLRHPVFASLLSADSGDAGCFTNLEITGLLDEVLKNLPAAGRFLENPEGQPDDLAHDAYFHVRRMAGEEPAVFVRSILAARLVFLKEAEEQAVTISHANLERIDRGLADLLSCVCGGEVGGGKHATRWHLPAQECAAMQRWVHGHLAFAVLSQGLILSFRAMGQAFRQGQTEELLKWANLSLSLLWASGASFVFTGDFPANEYENTIRPSMTPPISAIGLSGLMSADHRNMAQTIRDMRPVLKAFGDQFPEQHDLLAEAMANVYDCHRFVCERFVGASPSILTAGRTERSGPSLIEQFKTLRLKPFEHPQRTARLTVEKTATNVGECPFKK